MAFTRQLQHFTTRISRARRLCSARLRLYTHVLPTQSHCTYLVGSNCICRRLVQWKLSRGALRPYIRPWGYPLLWPPAGARILGRITWQVDTHSLEKFKLCMEKLRAVVRCNPNNTEAWTEIKRLKQRLSEEETGSYQFDIMYKQAKATPPFVDCATYVGPVAIRVSTRRGNSIQEATYSLCESNSSKYYTVLLQIRLASSFKGSLSIY